MTTPLPSPVQPARPANHVGHVAFVGAGPGDPGLLTVRAADLLRQADVVVTDQLDRRELLLRLCVRDGVEVHSAGEGGDQLSRATRTKLVASAADGGRRVVRLLDGDPSLYTGVADEVSAARAAGHDVEIVPGISAVAAVPAYSGVPLRPRTSSTVHVISAPGAGQADGASVELPAAHAADGATVIVLGAPETLAATVERLLDLGWDADTPTLAVSRATTSQQVSRAAPLAKAATAVGGLPAPTTLLVGEAVTHHDGLSWFETRPLFGWRVLVPRTKAQSASLVERIAELGGVAEVVPTISVEPPRSPQQMDKAVRGLVTGRYEWVGFTSTNAVRAVRERFDGLGLDVRSFSGLKVAAVGGATAEALRDWGLEPDLVPSGEQSASGLLADWPPYDAQLDPIDRVLLPRADIATETLVAGLQENGWEVDDVTAYRTVRASPPPAEIRDAIKSGGFDAVLFTSSSTVRNLVGIAGKPHPATVIACIGPKTAATAEEHGLRVDVLAPEPSAAVLVEALGDYGAAMRLAAVEAGQQPARPSQRRVPSRRRAR